MTSELEIAVADSLPHLSGGRRRRSPPSGPCANCGADLQGIFCHACGQSSDTRKRSIRHLVWEAIVTTFELDGRLFRTVPALFFRPGGLARDYIEGRIVRHVPPFRTFLVALLLFILAAQHATHLQTVEEQHKKDAKVAALATPQGRAAEVTRIRGQASDTLAEALKEAADDRADGLQDPVEKPDRVQAAYDRRIAKAQTRHAEALARADRVARGLPAEDPAAANAPGSKARDGWLKVGIEKATANPDYYWTVVFSWAQRLTVILLPIVGLGLALVYRRRKDVYLYDHLLVAMNLLSFNFLTNALGLILPYAVMPFWFGLLALWTPVNLFQTLRGAYGSSILGAVLKTLIVWAITAVSSVALLTGLLVLAVVEL